MEEFDSLCARVGVQKENMLCLACCSPSPPVKRAEYLVVFTA